MKRTRLLLCVIIGLWSPWIALAAQQKAIFTIADQNKIHPIAAGGTLDLQVDAKLPVNTHLYIRHLSSLSFSIVTTASAAENSGFRAEFVEFPAGRNHDQDEILEGKGAGKAGTWKLRVFEVQGRSVTNKVWPVKINITSQVCNSQTNRCYRPQTTTATIKVRVSGPKVQTSMRSASAINWLTSVADAKTKASSSGKNIYVIITAPTWCGYCKQMERYTFTDANVAKILNSGFIPLRILDDSPDLNTFRFSGYPTQILLKSDFSEITRSIPRQPADLYSFLGKYSKTSPEPGDNQTTDTQTGESFRFTVTLSGTFRKESDNNWVRITKSGEREEFTETRRGNQFIVLQSKQSKQYIALPEKGGPVYLYTEGKWQKAAGYTVDR
ncbi:MAG: thioredoxin family protein [Leptospiraceae bacterium]|nr:thioredoxin family protein [Leptospiraceae bacterium]